MKERIKQLAAMQLKAIHWSVADIAIALSVPPKDVSILLVETPEEEMRKLKESLSDFLRTTSCTTEASRILDSLDAFNPIFRNGNDL